MCSEDMVPSNLGFNPRTTKILLEEAGEMKNVSGYIIISKTDYYAKEYSNFNFKNY